MDADEFGADLTPVDEATSLTPGRLLAKLWNATREQRLDMAEKMITYTQRESNCFVMDHRGQLEHAAQRLKDLNRQVDDLAAALLANQEGPQH